MMTKFQLFFVLLGIFSFTDFAQAAAPDFSVSVQNEKGVTKIVLTPPPHHHFNLKAPLSFHWKGESQQPPLKSKKPSAVEFLLNKKVKAGDEGFYEAAAYLCDDANTYCEKKTSTGKLILPATQIKSTTMAPSAAEKPQAAPAFHVPGFIYNDAAKALALARKQNKPLLIDFYGIWCPPCNELDNTVFSTPSFRKSSQRFVNLKLDADDPASWSLKERYKIGGYPTVVFANSKGDEITRIVGSRDKTEFLNILEQAWHHRAKSFAALKAGAAKGDAQAAYEAGLIYLERSEFESAELLLKKASSLWSSPQDPRQEKLWAAQTGVLKTKLRDAAPSTRSEIQNQLLKTYNLVLENANHGVFKLMTTSELAEFYEDLNRNDETEKTQTKIISEAQYLLDNPSLYKNQELKSVDLLQIIGAAQKTLGQEPQARETYLRAAQEYKKALRDLGPAAKTDRGLQLELAYCLAQGGKDGEAVMLYQQLQQRYPQEFTFYFGHARLLFQKKDFKNSEVLAQKAFDYSYGDNRLRAGQLLAQVLEAEGKDKQALQLIEQVLFQAKQPQDPFNRTHRYLKQLKSLQEKIGHSSKAET